LYKHAYTNRQKSGPGEGHAAGGGGGNKRGAGVARGGGARQQL
jgi:hypothetical protein